MINRIYDLETTDKHELYEAIKDAFYKPNYEKVINKLEVGIAKGCCVYVDIYEGKVLGAIGILKGMSNEIVFIGVNDLYRRKGFGKALVDYAIKEYGEIEAETDDDAIEFYRRIGFKCNEIQRDIEGNIIRRYKCIIGRKF